MTEPPPDRAALARMMPDAFPLLFAERRPYEIQAQVMPAIVRGDDVLFAAPTASGKTEAAVTPLLQRHLSFGRAGLSIVYVAPTKALVNDIHERLLSTIGIHLPGSIARYTGDRHEAGGGEAVCLIATPEALDSLQLRRPQTLARVRAVVVDEIHLLHGEPRGQQLRHVIGRMERAATPPFDRRDRFQTVGMTATLRDMEQVAQLWLGPDAKVIAHGAPRAIDLTLQPYVERDGEKDLGRATALAGWLRDVAADKVLAFANSRNGAHAVAAHLHRLLEGTAWPVHLHFGALSATQREDVEREMRERRRGVCVATSTLEIGIDIGDVDAVALLDPPASVSGFLQRIGRGNRRSGTCHVVALYGSENERDVFAALLECARCGELDDRPEYRRPSVVFQQVLSLCWRATRRDHPLSPAALTTLLGPASEPVVADMLDTGALVDVRGALIPSDVLMDLGDEGRIHSVIAGGAGPVAVDLQTGDAALRDVEATSHGGAVLLGGALRRYTVGPDGGVIERASASSHRLARIRARGRGVPFGRAVATGLARQAGLDPRHWVLAGNVMTTWGGDMLNMLLAAILNRETEGTFEPTATAILGNWADVPTDPAWLRRVAREAQVADDLPLAILRRFTQPSRFFTELSSSLQTRERASAVPWSDLHRWLDGVRGLDGPRPDLAAAQPT